MSSPPIVLPKYIFIPKILDFCSIPLQCCEGPAHTSSLCPVSPAPLGPRTFWVPAPEPSSLLLQDSSQAQNVLSLSVHCAAYPLPHHPPCIPAAWLEPAPAESPQSHSPRSQGYSVGRRQEWSGCPVNSDCLWRKLRMKWTRSWWASRCCQVRSPCWWLSSTARKRGGKTSCGGSGLIRQQSSGLSRSPGLREEEATHLAGSCSRLKTKRMKVGNNQSFQSFPKQCHLNDNLTNLKINKTIKPIQTPTSSLVIMKPVAFCSLFFTLCLPFCTNLILHKISCTVSVYFELHPPYSPALTCLCAPSVTVMSRCCFAVTKARLLSLVLSKNDK